MIKNSLALRLSKAVLINKLIILIDIPKKILFNFTENTWNEAGKGGKHIYIHWYSQGIIEPGINKSNPQPPWVNYETAWDRRVSIMNDRGGGEAGDVIPQVSGGIRFPPFGRGSTQPVQSQYFPGSTRALFVGLPRHMSSSNTDYSWQPLGLLRFSSTEHYKVDGEVILVVVLYLSGTNDHRGTMSFVLVEWDP